MHEECNAVLVKVKVWLRMVGAEKLPSWCCLLHRDIYFLQWHLFSFAFAGIWNSRQVWLTNRGGTSGEQVVFGILRLLFIKRLSLYLAFCTLIASIGSQIAPGLWMRLFSWCNEVYWQTQLLPTYCTWSGSNVLRRVKSVQRRMSQRRQKQSSSLVFMVMVIVQVLSSAWIPTN